MCEVELKTDDVIVFCCLGTHCLSPPDPPKSSSLQTFGYDGNPIRFNSKVNYVCQRKQKFLDNFGQIFVTAQCLPDNLWVLPASWGTCVESNSFLINAM